MDSTDLPIEEHLLAAVDLKQHLQAGVRIVNAVMRIDMLAAPDDGERGVDIREGIVRTCIRWPTPRLMYKLRWPPSANSPAG